MNTHLLNQGQIGNGAPTTNKYWSAAVALTASAVTAFQILIGISGQVALDTAADFTRYVGIQAAQTVSATSADGFARIIKMVSSISVTASASCSMLVGRVRQLVSSVLFIAQGAVLFFRQRPVSASTTAVVSGSAAMGVLRGIQADVQLAVSSSANFSNFGEYATDDRVVLVPEEDRRIEVA